MQSLGQVNDCTRTRRHGQRAHLSLEPARTYTISHSSIGRVDRLLHVRIVMC